MMAEKTTNKTQEVLKEFGRVIVLAVVATIVTKGAEFFGAVENPTETITLLTLILRVADKVVVEGGLNKGITRF